MRSWHIFLFVNNDSTFFRPIHLAHNLPSMSWVCPGSLDPLSWLLSMWRSSSSLSSSLCLQDLDLEPFGVSAVSLLQRFGKVYSPPIMNNILTNSSSWGSTSSPALHSFLAAEKSARVLSFLSHIYKIIGIVLLSLLLTSFREEEVNLKKYLLVTPMKYLDEREERMIDRYHVMI